MTSKQTWTSLPIDDKTDAALRVAAALVCGFTHGASKHIWWTPDEQPIYEYCWWPDQNRDDLARVFAAALEKLDMEQTINDMSFWRYWGWTLDDPRAALCALLDLLSVPVPQELQP